MDDGTDAANAAGRLDVLEAAQPPHRRLHTEKAPEVQAGVRPVASGQKHGVLPGVDQRARDRERTSADHQRPFRPNDLRRLIVRPDREPLAGTTKAGCSKRRAVRGASRRPRTGTVPYRAGYGSASVAAPSHRAGSAWLQPHRRSPLPDTERERSLDPSGRLMRPRSRTGRFEVSVSQPSGRAPRGRGQLAKKETNNG